MTIGSRNKELILAALTHYYNANLGMAEQFESFNMALLAARNRDTANQLLRLIDEIAAISVKD